LDNSVRIENVVATVNFSRDIDIYALFSRNPYLNYDPKKFPGVAVKFAKPKTTALIFSSGKAVIVGAKSEEDVKLVVKRVRAFLVKNGMKVSRSPKVTIRNVVASFSLGRPVNLERLGLTLRGSIYEPEQFPGLIHRTPAAVFIIFSSGRVICAGAKGEKQALSAIAQAIDELEAAGSQDHGS